MVNRENMEKWINALEAYDREPARGMLRDPDGGMCAVGIGLNVMDPGCLVTSRKSTASYTFPAWLGIRGTDYTATLKPDGSGYDHVTSANDRGFQSPWTIAQRLRETYLKEEES